MAFLTLMESGLFLSELSFWCSPRFESWVQLESDDLVHFTETGVKVLPDTPLDSHGAYSGSAMQFGDNLFLFIQEMFVMKLDPSSLPDWSFDGQRWQDYKD